MTPETAGARKPRVLVSILNHNKVDLTLATIQSLKRTEYPNFDLQLVDAGSTNDCVQRILEVEPGLRVVYGENLGYTGGNNLALDQGLREGYDHVVFCNEDIEVEPNALGFLVETAEAFSDSAVVGAVETDYFTGALRAIAGQGVSFVRGRVRWEREPPPTGTHVVPALYVQGAMVLVTRRALEAGLRLDTNLFIYYDEADLGLSARALGLRAYVDTRVVVRHKNLPPGTPPWWSCRSAYLHHRNRVYLVHKYGSASQRVLFHLGMALVELPAKAVLRTLQGHPRFAAYSAIGYLDGVLRRMGPGRVRSIR